MELLFLIFLALMAFFFFFFSEYMESKDVDSDQSGASEQSGKQQIAVFEPVARARRAPSTHRAVTFMQTLGEAAGLAAATMAAVAVGTVVVGVMVAADLIRSGLEYYQKTYAGTDAKRERERHEQEIRGVNSEIFEFENKQLRDGHLSEYECLDLDELRRRRDDKALLLTEANGLVIADRVTKGAGVYDNMYISDVNNHILQFHVGQTVLGKVCGRCGMPMILQWQQRLDRVQMKDFFWGCAGFYDGKCRNVEPFVRSDMTLFTNTDREEFTISTSELNSIARLPQSVRLIRRRMNGLVHVANSTYYCPVHHEAMVLRVKKGAESLRDMYFYGCTRWRPSGPSCNQIVKLKSAAQLSAALETMSGRGIL